MIKMGRWSGADFGKSLFLDTLKERHRTVMRLAQYLLETVDCEGLRDLLQAFFASIPYEWHAARRCRRANNDIANYEGYYASVFYSYFAALGYEITVRGSRRSGAAGLGARAASGWIGANACRSASGRSAAAGICLSYAAP